MMYGVLCMYHDVRGMMLYDGLTTSDSSICHPFPPNKSSRFDNRCEEERKRKALVENAVEMVQTVKFRAMEGLERQCQCKKSRRHAESEISNTDVVVSKHLVGSLNSR